MPQSIARPVFQVSVAAIMLFQVAALFARSRLELSLIEDGMREAVAHDLSYLVVPLILGALMFPYLNRYKAQVLDLLRPSALTWRLVLLSLLLGLTLRIIRWGVLTLLIRTGALTNDDPTAIVGPIFGFDCPSPPVLLLSLGVTAFLIPIIEEVISRGFILHALLPRGLAISIGISALLFALVHPPGTYISAFMVGGLLAIQTLNQGTLWAAVVAHATYNAAAVLDWKCFQLVWNPPASDPQLATLSMIAAPVVIAGAWLACFIVTRRPAGAG
ncbi:MAG: lysostaphin resistance A-like protein [Geminicoccales bacterium]